MRKNTPEFPDFYLYLLRSNKFDEDFLNDHVDSSYNQDTYMWEIVDAITAEYGYCGSSKYADEDKPGYPKKVSVTRVQKLLKELSSWTVQTRTSETKVLLAMSNKYSEAGAKYFVRHWTSIVKLLT